MTNREDIYIEGLGYRNSLTEASQIIWFLQQYVKRYRAKSQITRFWLNILENHEKRLLEVSAYELLSFLKSKVSDEQRFHRIKVRLMGQINGQLELEKMKSWQENYELKMELTKIASLN